MSEAKVPAAVDLLVRVSEQAQQVDRAKERIAAVEKRLDTIEYRLLTICKFVPPPAERPEKRE